MRYGTVEGVTLPVSRLVQGTMMLTMEDLDYSFAILDAAFEAGCNTFDTAHVYGGGNCERALGRWIAERGLRGQVVVIDKGAHPNADRRRVTDFDIAADLHDSLARLQTDYIDLYLLHRDDLDVPVGPIVEALNAQAGAGRIRAFGGSNWTHARLAEANAYAETHGLRPFVASSPHFSLAEQIVDPWGGCVTITGAHNAEARAWYAANRMPVFAWSSLANGFLSGAFSRADIETHEDAEAIFIRCYRCEANLKRLDRAAELARAKGLAVPQIATAWVLHQPLDIFPLVGCSSTSEFKTNATALDIALSEAELAYLNLRG